MNIVKSTTLSIALPFLIIFFLAPTAIKAFDGDRKGFVAGFGLGATPAAHWSRSVGNINETEQGVVGNYIIGHGISSRDLIVWNLVGATATGISNSDKLGVQGIHGIQWYHFASEGNRSVYASVGVGLTAFATDRIIGQRGFGFKAEIGYEAEKHLLIGVYGIIGRTSRSGIATSHNQFGFLMSALAY